MNHYRPLRFFSWMSSLRNARRVSGGHDYQKRRRSHMDATKGTVEQRARKRNKRKNSR